MSKSSSSRKFSRLLALGLTMALGGVTLPIYTLSAQQADPAGTAAEVPPMQVIAHRGGAMARPENTMPAFHHAAGMGVDYIEFDMMMTRDNRIAVHHDTNINSQFCKPEEGASIAAGPLRGYSFAETQAFDCGSAVRASYAGDRFMSVPGARIPALEEVFATFKGSDALFFTETKIPKDSDIDPVMFATLLDDAVRRHGLEDRVILQSFDFRTVDALHAINPRIRTCLLGVPRHTREYLAILRKHNATCIVLSHDEIDVKGVRSLRDAGVLVFSGVADTQEDWKKYATLGFDALFTNDPEAAIDFLRQAEIRGRESQVANEVYEDWQRRSEGLNNHRQR